MDFLGKSFKSVGGLVSGAAASIKGQSPFVLLRRSVENGANDKEAAPAQYISWEDPYEAIAFSIIYIALICIIILAVVVPYHLFIVSFLSIDTFGKQLYSSTIQLKSKIDIGLGVLLILMTFHRCLGYMATKYLQGLLMSPSGSFHMSIDWISLRLGLDHNEIIITNFTWWNPPAFKNTEYFVRISKFSVLFDFRSLCDALFAVVWYGHQGKAVPAVNIIEIELEGSDVYIEKGEKKSQGLNLWACLGSENEDDDAACQESYTRAMTDALSSTASGASDLGMTIANSAVGGIKSAADGITTGFKGGIQTMKKAIAYRPLTSSGKRLERFRDTDMATDENPSELELEDEDAPANEENPVDASDGQQSSPISSKEKEIDKKKSQSNGNKVPSEKTKAWGVPLRFNVERLTVRDLKLHAQDFLNARHTDHSDASFIHIQLMHMTHKELTGKRSSSPWGHTLWEPVWLDELVWKIIDRAINELLATNQLKLMSIMASAAASQTTDAMVKTGRAVKDTVFNYNPLKMAKAMKNVVTSSKTHRTAGSQLLQLSLLYVEDVVDSQGNAPNSITCEVSILEGGEESEEPLKSSIRSIDSLKRTVFHESFDLEFIDVSTACLHVDVFRPRMMEKKVRLCGCVVPLQEVYDELYSQWSQCANDKEAASSLDNRLKDISFNSSYPLMHEEDFGISGAAFSRSTGGGKSSGDVKLSFKMPTISFG